jgi:2-polyprenyl-6-methoxyphenol hydroxylase-like FAD-dependent oxidoreductase
VPDETTPVLIAGGGLVGLATSLFLAQQGVQCVLVERHPGTSVHPRAWGLYPRTMELLRGSGAAEDVLREAAGFAEHTLNGVVESLAGREITATRLPDPEDVSDFSPAPRVIRLSQDRIEPILRRHAARLGADLRFGTEMVAVEQDEAGVTATLRPSGGGAASTIRAKYLVAADGARSEVREQLGIEQSGRGVMRHQISILFRADLAGPLRGRRFAICRVRNPEVEGVLGHDDTLSQGTLIITYHPESTVRQSMADFPPERCAALVRAAVGDPGLPVEIVSALPWEMAMLVAERFSAGRIFLAGDAAHVIPPVGGYGANTGIQDGHNLAWKLAAVLHGHAGARLLDTYDAERRPVARMTAEQAALRLADRASFATPDQKAAIADPLTVMFGYRYDSSAVVGAAADGPAFVAPRALNGAPGTRAPHVWLRHRGHVVSTLDLLGTEPVLLAAAKADDWWAAATELAGRRPLRAYRLGEDLTETDRTWHTAFGVGPGGAVLVRPDGIVGWRAEDTRPAAMAELTAALDAVLGRTPA